MSKLLFHSLSFIRPTATTTTTTSSFLLKKSFTNDIQTLTQRVSTLRLTVSYFHTNSPFHEQQQQQQQQDQQQQDQQQQLSWKEQQKNALAVERKSGLRSRCVWLKEEDALLLKLQDEIGPHWSRISRHFINRPPGHVWHRYMRLTDSFARGPWSKEELEKLRKLCQDLPPDSKQLDWDHIQQSLPVPRPLYLIKQKYRGSLDPTIKLGIWSAEESEKLRSLVMKYGENKMAFISTLMGNRTRRQCNERWRWQMSDVKKGRYTIEEDEAIKRAVETYGENFAVIAKVTGIKRTPRHISQHYRNMLAPGVDRSKWTNEEEQEVYNTFLQSDRDMVLTKKKLKSNRSVRDMWNHIAKVNRQLAKQANTRIKKEEVVDEEEKKSV